MHDFLKHHDQTPPEERRTISAEVADTIRATIEPDPVKLSPFVERMGDPTAMDGWTATHQLTDSLGDAYDLYWGDLELQRVCLGNEHATAVFDGNEIDYVPLFSDNPELLKITRLTALLQDSGKVLSVAKTGNNRAQSEYNEEIARKVVESVSDEVLSENAKKAVIALVGQDIIGKMLQGHDIQASLEQFKADWPEELEEYRDDLLLASYLSDASAHSSYRLYRNARNGFVEPAVQPHDRQLTFLFERHRSGAITLTPDRSQTVLAQFPEINRMKYLLTGELGPYAREDEVFAEVVARKALGNPDNRMMVREPGQYTDTVYVMDPNSGMGVSANILTYPHVQPDSPIDQQYWLPGDGRVWERSVQAGALAFMDEYGPMPEPNPHPDPEIAAMQHRVRKADWTYDSTIGSPLLPEDAWQTIHKLENL